MQQVLDRRINKEKELEGQDLLTKKVLSLQVELGELANEWRGFKFWSNDQSPRTEKGIVCDINDFDEMTINPLLEEYVDCLHFFLSIANELRLSEDDLFSYDDCLPGDTTKLFIELLNYVGLIEIQETRSLKVLSYRIAFFIFINIGKNRLGLDWNEIYAAYLQKNKINHKRQEEGY